MICIALVGILDRIRREYSNSDEREGWGVGRVEREMLSIRAMVQTETKSPMRLRD
jgi:hypothetical protein